MLAGGFASDDRDTRNYWIMAPGAGHHPLRRNPDPNLGSPPKGRLRTTERTACWRQPRTRARPGRRDLVQSKTYEITFLGQAGTTLSAEFDDCEVTIGPGTTTLRAELPDRGALSGLIERINSLGLDVIDVSLVAPPAGR